MTAVQLNINLQRVAMLSIGQALWRTSQVGRLIRQLFYSEEDDDRCQTIRHARWSELAAMILRDLREQRQQLLPECLMHELLHVVEHVGDEIYDWHDFVRHLNESVYRKHDQKLDCPRRLFWTWRGDVDAKRVVEDNWLGDNLHIGNVLAVYNVACRCGVDARKVDGIWRSVRARRRDDDYRSQLFGEAAYANAYYANLRDRDIQLFAKTLRFIVEERLLEPFVEQAHVELLKSLWPKLRQSTKDDRVVGLCRLALKRWRVGSMKFERKQHAKVVVFLIGQMTREQRQDVYVTHIEQLLRLLFSYPWQELLFSVLHEYWIDVNKQKSSVIGEFLRFIVERIGGSGETGLFRVILRAIWFDMPTIMKCDMDLSRIVYSVL